MAYGKLIAGLAVAAAVGVALSGGDTNAGTNRDPYTKPIDAPGDEEMQAVKQAFCACYRGGATEEDALTVCALKQVYGDEPWADLLEPVAGDSREVRTVVGMFRGLARELLALPSEAAMTQWCGLPGRIDPPTDPVEPPPPPADDLEVIRTEWRELQSDVAYPGRFVQIVKDGSGLEVTARRALNNAGIENPSYKKLVLPLARAFSAGKRWNVPLYWRTAKPKTPNGPGDSAYQVDGRIVSPVFNPRHADANLAVLQGDAPKRTIYNDGSKSGGGSSYGRLWVPKFNIDMARDEGVLIFDEDSDVDPPDSFLTLIGM